LLKEQIGEGNGFRFRAGSWPFTRRVGDQADGAVCWRSLAMLSGFRTKTGATAYESDTCDVADVTAGAEEGWVPAW
jgi:hypothetical protein